MRGISVPVFFDQERMREDEVEWVGGLKEGGREGVVSGM